jgi:hypothetical protein
MVIRILDALVFVFRLGTTRDPGRPLSLLDLLALGEHTLALLSEVKVRGKGSVPSDHLTSALKKFLLVLSKLQRG